MHRTFTTACLIVATAAAAAGTAAAAANDPPPERGRELVRLVRHECGACHGLALTGGLGPALLPQNLAGKSFDALVATVMRGRPGSAMPGWSRFMNEDEARWLVRSLLDGFPALAGGERE